MISRSVHDAEELLTSEKIRFVQPYRETLVQFSPLHRRQAYLQRAFAECQSDIHHLFGQLGQLLSISIPLHRARHPARRLIAQV